MRWEDDWASFVEYFPQFYSRLRLIVKRITNFMWTWTLPRYINHCILGDSGKKSKLIFDDWAGKFRRLLTVPRRTPITYFLGTLTLPFNRLELLTSINHEAHGVGGRNIYFMDVCLSTGCGWIKCLTLSPVDSVKLKLHVKETMIFGLGVEGSIVCEINYVDFWRRESSSLKILLKFEIGEVSQNN